MENSNALNSDRLRLAIEQSPVAIALFDLQTRLVACSNSWRKDFGLGDRDLAGLSYKDLVSHTPKQWQDAYRRTLQGYTSSCEPHLLTLPDGTATWMQGKLAPWRDETDNLCGVIWTTEMLSEAEQADFGWGNVFKLSPDLHCIAGLDGYLKRLNPAWELVLGYSLEDLKSRPFVELVHPDDLERTLEAARTLAEGGVHETFENRYCCRDGSYRWLQWTAISLVEQQLIYAVARDITRRKHTEIALRESEAQLRKKANHLSQTLQELRQTQMQLMQTEKMSSLGQLIAGVAHEINNPVNFIYGNLVHAKEYTEDILGLLQLYQDCYSNPSPEIQDEADAIDLEFLVDDLPQLLSSMMVGANRIKDIVASLRNFSRMDEAEMTLVDLHEGIDSTLTILQNRIKAKPDRPAIAIVKEYSDLPKIECFVGQLNQVFMNIISNAVDALEERDRDRTYQEVEAHPSSIRICTAKHGDNAVSIRIIDNGLGIEETIRDRLFEPFFTTKPIGKGTGLGLSISYQIITDKHGGTLTCRSVEGEGTEFEIVIPINQIDN
ncbi:PAS domain-containing sensor histidine kinase [Baaleninema simplex]|uniref:PAS domain-containing sensor histidine kinase n=1 Tax=Baaleninema simplex TaxID=2862350 RepID=UPI000347EB03|nr:PAS domain S-box protein [Baaleninema simplex]